MGTKGSYTGSGGPDGKRLRDTVDDWLDNLPPGPSDQSVPAPADLPRLNPNQILPVAGLFRPRTGGHADGPGGGGGAGVRAAQGAGSSGSRAGVQRSAAQSARAAGRAAGAAYAYRTGDAEALRELGLDYASLRALDDPVDVARHIVDAVCGPLSDGTIEDDERRTVAAEVTQWVLEANTDGAPPTLEEVVRVAIAEAIFEAFSAETADRLHRGERPAWVGEAMDRQVREAAEALAERAALSPTGPTPTEFAQAVEQSLEALRDIYGGGS